MLSFNTQPPEGGWLIAFSTVSSDLVSTHSRLKAAGSGVNLELLRQQVSTHSRLKAAGRKTALPFQLFNSFNTQPPEGGWADSLAYFDKALAEFQHTAA